MRWPIHRNGLLIRVLGILFMGMFLTTMVWLLTYYQRHWNLIEHRLAVQTMGEIDFIVGQSPVNITKNYIQEVEDNFLILLRTDSVKDCQKNPKQSSSNNPYFTAKLIKASPYNLNIIGETRQYITLMAIKNNQCLVFDIPLKRLTSTTSYIFVLISFGGTIIILIIASLLLRNQMRPFVRLANLVDSNSKNHLWENAPNAPYIKPSGSHEARQIARAINEFYTRIHQFITERTQMLSGVSHDLRTPLTRMKLQIAMMPQSNETTRLSNNIDEMKNMIDGYLQFIQGQGNEPLSECDIEGFFQEIRDNWGGEYVIYLHCENNARFNIRKMLMTRAINNIIANGIHYGSAVWINCRILHDIITISIDDNGPGIPENERQLVFKPFYRTDKGRGRIKTSDNKAPKNFSSVGLGLTVTRDIILQHQGNIELGDSPHGGLRVMISLPL